MIDKKEIIDKIEFSLEEIDGNQYLSSKFNYTISNTTRFPIADLQDLNETEFEIFKIDKKTLIAEFIFEKIYGDIAIELITMLEYNDGSKQPELEESIKNLLEKITLRKKISLKDISNI